MALFNPTAPLRRSRRDRMIAGVCSGLARHLGMDPMLVRVIYLIFFIATIGTGTLVYLFMWMFVPEEG